MIELENRPATVGTELKGVPSYIGLILLAIVGTGLAEGLCEYWRIPWITWPF